MQLTSTELHELLTQAADRAITTNVINLPDRNRFVRVLARLLNTDPTLRAILSADDDSDNSADVFSCSRCSFTTTDTQRYRAHVCATKHQDDVND
jgi:hypothetical protein